ncbi:antitoxin Xre/MbcA/ParS toxin-binding domain-containing protein [Magnetospirillum fulvum]|jgi:hypothetical protein|uniref:Antitoxin Xre/MbcA/ParS-like toxin-binding domain-containing protein n=1 Tax=Magnetospirillum fulvum MGU-K5 TaxID=1316936 RepID=S9SB08_MAGFU|nr:antitoxin Xre/MbcA/ParS toxin-binding domain-containing protein [Magnetospirillum fulvum]EPY01258.1 hypothetical protein K678_11895 [Magnetospirillum fulvum MGU-K5]
MFETKEHLAQGVASIFRILDHWRLSEPELRGILGFPFGTQLTDWRAGELGGMTSDVIKRLGAIASIFKQLRNTPEAGTVWLHQPIPLFGNRTPLARMASGDLADLIAVDDYLKLRTAAEPPKSP